MPRPIVECDLRGARLTPEEAFLLSQVDGELDEQELAAVLSRPPQEVRRSLERLAAVGAVTLRPASSARRKAPSEPSAVAIDALRALTQPAAEDPPASGIAAEDPPKGLYDPAELDEPVELDRAQKRRILDTYYRLGELSHYDLLGIPFGAPKKEIKGAYFRLAPEFHPDKYFRKELGSFRHKLEQVFGRLTVAHDTLTSEARRKEYDDYLAQAGRNRSLEALLLVAQAKTLPSMQAVSADPPPAPAPGAPPATQYRMEQPAVGRDADRRREVLASKLGGLRARLDRPSTRPPPLEGPEHDPGEALRRHFERTRTEVRRAQLARYLDAARSAESREDHAAAANAYRIAISLFPDEAELQVHYRNAARRAAVQLADGLRKQAEYEASTERWTEAAVSYAKACAGRPDDATLHERAAFAMLRCGANLHRAAEFGQRAVALAPREVDYRVTLASIYLAAGLAKSARVELERASELQPTDARVRDLLRGIK